MKLLPVFLASLLFLAQPALASDWVEDFTLADNSGAEIRLPEAEDALPVPQEGPQDFRYLEGQPGCSSQLYAGYRLKVIEGAGLRVAACYLGRQGNLMRFEVAVDNEGVKPVDVSPACMTLQLLPKGELKAENPDALAGRVANAGSFGIGLSNFFLAMSAPTSTTTTGEARTIGNTTYMTASTPNYANQYLMQQQAIMRNQQIRAQAAARGQAVSASALRGYTVQPGDTNAGAVYFSTWKRKEAFVLHVVIGNNTFDFPFCDRDIAN